LHWPQPLSLSQPSPRANPRIHSSSRITMAVHRAASQSDEFYSTLRCKQSPGCRGGRASGVSCRRRAGRPPGSAPLLHSEAR